MAPFCVQRAGLGTGACNLIAAWCSEHCTSLWQRWCSVGRRRSQRRCSQFQQVSALSLEVWEHFCHLVASPRDPVGACCPEKVAERDCSWDTPNTGLQEASIKSLLPTPELGHMGTYFILPGLRPLGNAVS